MSVYVSTWFLLARAQVDVEMARYQERCTYEIDAIARAAEAVIRGQRAAMGGTWVDENLRWYEVSRVIPCSGYALDVTPERDDAYLMWQMGEDMLGHYLTKVEERKLNKMIRTAMASPSRREAWGVLADQGAAVIAKARRAKDLTENQGKLLGYRQASVDRLRASLDRSAVAPFLPPGPDVEPFGWPFVDLSGGADGALVAVSLTIGG
jgi:hypothetical protein